MKSDHHDGRIARGFVGSTDGRRARPGFARARSTRTWRSSSAAASTSETSSLESRRDSGGENSPESIIHHPARSRPAVQQCAAKPWGTTGFDATPRSGPRLSPRLALADRPQGACTAPETFDRSPSAANHLRARRVVRGGGARAVQFSPTFFSLPPCARKTRPDPTRARAPVEAGIGFPPSSRKDRAALKTEVPLEFLTDRHRSQPEFDRRSSRSPEAEPRGRDIPKASAGFPPLGNVA